ncbi:hypothetical protein QEH44_gp29 [Arthrobacter phage Shambre1]|uniref:Uncharacterized protein n=1 Tax=Arthrobacter phage Shambre1 TaxID=2927284 RepID=A0A977KNN4_9CAUD|nr:hypothetical protein QEH44_gp29 [Arthrobacter phage Shambre1]UXE04802.1 hypothetical protein SEA_SHAMBRE1_29 [Arthrobacter phage Shambre1]
MRHKWKFVSRTVGDDRFGLAYMWQRVDDPTVYYFCNVDLFWSRRPKKGCA